VVPGPGGTSLHFVTFPPDSVFADPSFDGEAERDEALIRLRGLADHLEKEDPRMHKTNTVDYSAIMKERFGWSSMTPRPFISSAVTSSCKTARATLAEQRHNSSNDVVFSEWRERVTPEVAEKTSGWFSHRHAF
jgi:hypothetical protein